MDWSFPSNNNAQVNGISDTGVETFLGSPLRSLAREICQNSLDAATGGSAVEIVFSSFTIEYNELPDPESLKRAFSAALDFSKSVEKAKEFYNNAIKKLKQRSIFCLRISDFNTSGLRGSKEEYNTDWFNLTKSSGFSDKSGVSGGSFGIGKYAPFACSDFRTVIYSTLDTDGIQASQGVSRLSSFFKEKEITQGIGFYGGENNTPLYQQMSLDPAFTRKQPGTDIFIVGFRYQNAWIGEIVASILDGFLYAVFDGNLIVRVDDVVINKETIPRLLKGYERQIKENAGNYYKIITSPDTVWTETDIRGYGLLKLGLMIDPAMHRKVAMVRKTGMKIMDQDRISSTPFAGILLIRGDDINKFLRSIENPQHTKWEPERYSVPEYARRIKQDIRRFIMDSLDELIKADSSEEIDPAVGEYLPDEIETDEKVEENKAEAVTDTVKYIEKNDRPRRISVSEMVAAGRDDFSSDLEGETYDEDNTSGTGGQGLPNNSDGGGYGDNEGDNGGENPEKDKKSQVSVVPAKKRIICLDKDKGEYLLILKPLLSAVDGVLELFYSAETRRYKASINHVESNDQSNLTVHGNIIKGILYKENQSLRIKVHLDYFDYCSMEVKAYGAKK